MNRLHILCGEPYTARVVRTVRGRVQGNLPIVISIRRQELIPRYFQNVRDYSDGENKLKSLMFGTAQQQTQAAFDLCNGFARYGAAALN
ncbi:hypothetical protein H8S90_23975 [Olivibacter sp. SDN3]|uniref:hypothetical protein n=1 Tax=Olivibacter sp. SDN3 TaxID=2764720 RepID=UPI001650EC23|nr:hypothetical protein [Olivibacter sp. SDN3]QNL49731.1 hypothetical protein H8S90_23975 [Olivibacter sp. SDN3]